MRIVVEGSGLKKTITFDVRSNCASVSASINISNCLNDEVMVMDSGIELNVL